MLEFAFSGTGYALRQRVSLWEGSRRIDFATVVDWRPDHKMLRVEFPVNVMNEEATYEIQYGSVKRPTHRNTSWDMARFEVVGHKWADLSQENYGVAILNDCKYGHQIKDNVISLALLRSTKSPDPKADMHTHAFTYALFPHEGNHVRGKVVREAYELNYPVHVFAAAPGRKTGARLPAHHSFVSVDSENILVEVVKRADDGKGTVLRLYESGGMDTRTVARLGIAVRRVDEVDLLERPVGRLRVRGKGIPLSFGPFEIKTIRVQG
jgi:alpha-mannosidase